MLDKRRMKILNRGLHHKKQRTRKKNMHRWKRECRKEARKEKQRATYGEAIVFSETIPPEMVYIQQCAEGIIEGLKETFSPVVDFFAELGRIAVETLEKIKEELEEQKTNEE